MLASCGELMKNGCHIPNLASAAPSWELPLRWEIKVDIICAAAQQQFSMRLGSILLPSHRKRWVDIIFRAASVSDVLFIHLLKGKVKPTEVVLLLQWCKGILKKYSAWRITGLNIFMIIFVAIQIISLSSIFSILGKKVAFTLHNDMSWILQ